VWYQRLIPIQDFPVLLQGPPSRRREGGEQHFKARAQKIMDERDFVSKLVAGGGCDHAQQPEDHASCISTGVNDVDAGDPQTVRSCREELNLQMKVRCASLLWALATPFALVFVTAASLFLAGFLRAVDALGLAFITILSLPWLQRHWYNLPKAGTYLNHTGAAGKRMARILARADLLRDDVYIAPPWYMGGDIATIATPTSRSIAAPCRRCVRVGVGSLRRMPGVFSTYLVQGHRIPWDCFFFSLLELIKKCAAGYASC